MICWIIEKAREFQKKICLINYTKAFDCVDHNKLWKILKVMGIPDQLTWLWASLVAQLVATLPAMWETGVRSLGWKDPLQKGKATQPYILAWRIPWTV